MRSKQFNSKLVKNYKRMVPVAAIVVLSLFLLIELVTPPESISKKIVTNPESYLSFRDGVASFDAADSPNQLSGTKKHPISLPFRNLTSFEDYDAENIWYEFQVDIPEKRFQKAQLGLLIPLIWGKSVVYVNGAVRDFGINVWPTIAIDQRKNLIQIRVSTKAFSKKDPIRATYPLVVSDIEKIRELRTLVEEQAQTRPRAFTAYGLAIILFGMLFLAYPKKPELLAFIVFLTASLFGSFVTELIDDKNVLFSWSSDIQKITLLLVDFFTQLSLIAFALFFLRAHTQKVKCALSEIGTVSFFLVPPSAIFLMKAFPSFDIRQAAHLTVSIYFAFFQLFYSAPRLIFILTRQEVPLQRKIGGAIICISILSLYAFNILDHFFYLTGITTLYSNGLILNLALSVTVAYEISRAEVNQNVLGSMLPREVKESMHLNKRQIDQEGFVLLVDAIGYSADRNRFANSDSRSSYIEKMAKNILGPVHDLQINDFSILSCTGDGLYFAIRGEPSKLNFEKVSQLARAIASRNEKGAETSILFRAAFGYGTYGVRIVECGQIRKEFVAGNILNDLARIIGSEKFRTSIRVLIGPEIGLLFSDAIDSQSVLDKHGFEHFFFELDEMKKAA